MSAHSEACQGSRALCEQLFAALKASVPELKCSPSKRWCGYYAPGRTRLAFISHFKRTARVEVWCRGRLSDLRAGSPPHVRPRGSTDAGGFEKDYPARFEVADAAQVAHAARLLHAVSYAAS